MGIPTDSHLAQTPALVPTVLSHLCFLMMPLEGLLDSSLALINCSHECDSYHSGPESFQAPHDGA